MGDINLHLCAPVQTGFGQQQPNELALHRFHLIDSAFRGIILTYKCQFDDVVLGSVSDTFEYVYDEVQNILTHALFRHKNIRISISLNVTLEHIIKKMERTVSLFTPFNRIFNQHYILETMRACADYLGNIFYVYQHS